MAATTMPPAKLVLLTRSHAPPPLLLRRRSRPIPWVPESVADLVSQRRPTSSDAAARMSGAAAHSKGPKTTDVALDQTKTLDVVLATRKRQRRLMKPVLMDKTVSSPPAAFPATRRWTHLIRMVLPVVVLPTAMVARMAECTTWSK